MANTFKRVSAQLGNTSTTVYTATGVTAVCIGGIAANQTADQATLIELTLNDTTYIVGKDTPLPVGGALNFVGGKLVMNSGDVLKGKAAHTATVDVTLSVMEQS